MLHDGVASQAASSWDGTERRAARRAPCPAEVTLIWHHDVEQVVRYRLVDVSDHGYRIQSSMPLVEGMTGTLLNVVPSGEALNQSIMVVRVQPSPEPGVWEIGLQCFRPAH